jgi:hypothetical protein
MLLARSLPCSSSTTGTVLTAYLCELKLRDGVREGTEKDANHAIRDGVAKCSTDLWWGLSGTKKLQAGC